MENETIIIHPNLIMAVRYCLKAASIDKLRPMMVNAVQIDHSTEEENTVVVAGTDGRRLHVATLQLPKENIPPAGRYELLHMPRNDFKESCILELKNNVVFPNYKKIIEANVFDNYQELLTEGIPFEQTPSTHVESLSALFCRVVLITKAYININYFRDAVMPTRKKEPRKSIWLGFRNAEHALHFKMPSYSGVDFNAYIMPMAK